MCEADAYEAAADDWYAVQDDFQIKYSLIPMPDDVEEIYPQEG